MFLFIPAVLMVVGGVAYSPVLAGSTQDQNRTCVTNPSGVLNVDVAGVPGAPGPRGSQGEVGPVGARGEKGRRGAKGRNGMAGETGPKGNEGQGGPIGTKGPKGSRGVEGLQGPRGERGAEGPAGLRGYPGPIGGHGPVGPSGPQGMHGLQGDPGDTVLSKEEFERIRQQVHSSILAEINATLVSVQDCCGPKTVTVAKCGINGPWKKIGAFNASNGESCPSHLRTVSNQDNTKRACVRPNRGPNVARCSSVSIPVRSVYRHVCGIVRGYQYGYPHHFLYGTNSIDSHYVDGISITHGSPRRHLWTYAAGRSERETAQNRRCPCARSSYLPTQSHAPIFVGNNFYCESGFVDRVRFEVEWNDPLWDGKGCHSRENQCCQQFGWFHRIVQTSVDDIELRMCSYFGYTAADTLLESYEFWVM